MVSYHAHYEGGRIVPHGNPVIPEGSEITFQVLEPPKRRQAETEEEKAFLQKVYQELEAGERDIEAGRVKDAFASLEALRKKYGL